MAVNLLEEDRLVYHDVNVNTLEILTSKLEGLDFSIIDPNEISNPLFADRDAVETLRDALTCWLETGRLK